jgi:hypothetical protein
MRMATRMVRNDRGVAMVTVLLIGAALTVLVSTAAFMSIQNLRASTDDRKAADALAYAEAGIDRILLEARKPTVAWDDLRQSCAGTPTFSRTGTIGNGTYDASMTVSDPSGNPAACPVTSVPRYTTGSYFAITSTGTSPQATRVVRQVVKVTASGLPVGVFAHSASINGNPAIRTTLISDGDVVGRDRMAFVGSDLFYKKSDFWPSLSSSEAVPTGVHATGVVYAGAPEHSVAAPLNCNANRTTGSDPGTQGQSQWDQSSSGGPIAAGTPACTGQSASPPPTSKFTFDDLERVRPAQENTYLTDQQYQNLKNEAKNSGIYCYIPSSGAPSCTKAGATWSVNLNSQISTSDVSGVPGNFVAYFDYQDASKATTISNLVHWGATVWDCAQDKSAFIVVRNGSFRIESPQLNGTLVVPEGNVDSQGNFVFNGSVLAKTFLAGGNGSYQVDQCWLDRMPPPWIQMSSHRWVEIDR